MVEKIDIFIGVSFVVFLISMLAIVSTTEEIVFSEPKTKDIIIEGIFSPNDVRVRNFNLKDIANINSLILEANTCKKIFEQCVGEFKINDDLNGNYNMPLCSSDADAKNVLTPQLSITNSKLRVGLNKLSFSDCGELSDFKLIFKKSVECESNLDCRNFILSRVGVCVEDECKYDFTEQELLESGEELAQSSKFVLWKYSILTVSVVILITLIIYRIKRKK